MNRTVSERLAAIVILALGGYWFFESFRFGELSALFPRIIAVALMVFTTIWLAQSFNRQWSVQPTDRATNRRAARQSLSLIVALLAWTALVPWIGLLYASTLGVTGLTLASFWGKEGTRRSVVVALVVVMVFYAAFRFLIRVPFPLPIWMQ